MYYIENNTFRLVSNPLFGEEPYLVTTTAHKWPLIVTQHKNTKQLVI